MTISALNLNGKEVKVEQRVLFKLDLPNRKVISVKSKPSKKLLEVLWPILNKYNIEFDEVQVFSKDSKDSIDISLPVTTVDQKHLLVVNKFLDGKYFIN